MPSVCPPYRQFLPSINNDFTCTNMHMHLVQLCKQKDRTGWKTADGEGVSCDALPQGKWHFWSFTYFYHLIADSDENRVSIFNSSNRRSLVMSQTTRLSVPLAPTGTGLPSTRLSERPPSCEGSECVCWSASGRRLTRSPSTSSAPCSRSACSCPTAPLRQCVHTHHQRDASIILFTYFA